MMKPWSLLILFFLIVNGTSTLFSQVGKVISVNTDIELIQLADSLYIHTSYEVSPNFGRFGSNGVLLVKNSQALLVDTPMGEEATKQLLKFVEDSLHVKVVKFIGGHYHNDCLGGLAYLHTKGVESIACKKTMDICKAKGLPIPQLAFEDSLCFTFNDVAIECRYLGGGHTKDNIVVYFPEYHVLFGGCLIKSLQSRGMGNVAEAVIEEWDISVEKVQKQYPDVNLVIPGHGQYGDKALLDHTVNLVGAYRSKMEARD